MQHVILALALLISATLFSQEKSSLGNTEGSIITITVVNALSDNGEVKYALYTKENFSKDPLYATSAGIDKGKSTVVFKNVPKGIYAVVCYHDENKNERLDFYENGRPKESYGASNNSLNSGPPQFEDSKFEVKDNDLTLEIKF